MAGALRDPRAAGDRVGARVVTPRGRKSRTAAAAVARSARRKPAAHAHAGARERRAGCAIVTVSDTRGPREDRSGDLAVRLLERAGHRVTSRAWTRDEPGAIRRAVRAALAGRTTDVVILTGGTGVSPRDRTPEAVRPLLAAELPGFGERFRALSVAEIGNAAWLSRAGAGVTRGRLVVYLPGSPAAVRLALGRVLIPELAHLLHVLGRTTRSA